jgi:membrane-bound lytic murein transglycosylase D
MIGEANAAVQPLSPPTPVTDAVMELLAASDRHFQEGRQALELGHVERARLEFDLAVNVMLDSPLGGRTQPRIRDYFDRLVDRISAYELRALAVGDGFSESASEPASIDELLAVSATLTPKPANPGLAATVRSDLTRHDIDIPLNPRVLSFIELFQGRMRDFIEEGMRRGSRYLPLIQRAFAAEGVPLDLGYIPLVESAFKTNALSRARARGVWQFIRSTGRHHGLRQDWYIDERSDPEKASVAAARYLKTLSRMFDGDWHLAMASYNGGPGRVQRAMRRSGADDFWELTAKSKALPRETRDYVPMVLAAVVIARNPAQYGFNFTPDVPLTYDTVVLDRPVDLRWIAEWTGTTIDEIQNINPELRRWTTPVQDAVYELKVPAGTHDLVRARLTEAVSSELVTLRYHTVSRGESLSSIARQLRVRRTDLAEANDMSANARLQVGQQLIVPRAPTVLISARAEPPSVGSADNGGSAEPVRVSYRVRRGDTLISIARAFGTSVALIRTWNGIQGSRIVAGDRLTIYTTRAN